MMDMRVERALVARICGEVSEAELDAARRKFLDAQRRANHYRDRPTFTGHHDQLDAEMLSAWAELVKVCEAIDSSMGGQQ